MYLPPPTPTNLKLARNLALSGPATQKVDGMSFSEIPAPVSHLPEPLQVTPALGPRCAIAAAAGGNGDIDPVILMGSDLPLISPLGRLTTHLPTPQRCVTFHRRWLSDGGDREDDTESPFATGWVLPPVVGLAHGPTSPLRIDFCFKADAYHDSTAPAILALT